MVRPDTRGVACLPTAWTGRSCCVKAAIIEAWRRQESAELSTLLEAGPPSHKDTPPQGWH